ncbi:MAG: hypothetical protein L0170_06350 [Acidobacteria bacterium]|nr:hypothetical protein [Acidobacteriota bacterium]
MRQVWRGDTLANIQHEAFAVEYAISGDNDKALAAGGYKRGKNTWTQVAKLLNRPGVSDRIREIREQIAEEQKKQLIISRSIVRNQTFEIVQQARAAIPVYGKNGEPTGEWRADFKAALMGLRMLGEELSMYTGKGGDRDLDSMLENKSDSELQDFIRGVIADLGESTVRGWLDEQRGSSGNGESTSGSPEAQGVAVQAPPQAVGIPRTGLLESGALPPGQQPVGESAPPGDADSDSEWIRADRAASGQ